MLIDPKDITVECYSLKESGGLTFGIGAGVKITHRNGMTAICDSERSQYRNRVKAMSTLEAMIVARPQGVE